MIFLQVPPEALESIEIAEKTLMDAWAYAEYIVRNALALTGIYFVARYFFWKL